MSLTYLPQLRMHSQLKAPLLSGEGFQVGFYDIGIARKLFSNGNFKYSQYTLPIPTNEEQFSLLVDYINKPNVEYAIVDKDKIVFFVIPGSQGWLSEFSNLGYTVKAGEKTNKRLKSFHRATLLSCDFSEDEINIVTVDDTYYSRHDFMTDPDVPDYLRDPSIFSRLLDGGFVISSRMINKAIDNLPIADDFINNDNEYYFDPNIRNKLIEFLRNSPVFNARIVFKDGFLKGNAFKCDLPEGIDIITSVANIKSEITFDKGFSFIAEPQGAKSKVSTDEQTMVNLPMMFPEKDLKFWLNEEFNILYNNAINDKLINANWNSFFGKIWSESQDIEDYESLLKQSYYALLYKHSGGKMTDSPWLFKTTAISKASQYRKKNNNNIRYSFPIPCSVYEQVISESLARMAGEEIIVERGTIRRSHTLQCHVLNDIDWLECYDSHGGHDQDDFFKIFYRELQGTKKNGKKVIIVRSPNGYGEYSIFDYVEGEWNPSWFDSNGDQHRFPIISGDNWPKRLSEAIRDKDVIYSGLPSQTKPKKQYQGLYSKDNFLDDVKIAMQGGSIGKYVNAYMIWSSVFQKHRPVHLCSLEDAVDICINPKDPDDVKLIDKESDKMIREVIESNLPIDQSLWYSRRGNLMLKPGESVKTHNTHLTALHRFGKHFYDQYCKRIESWAQNDARPSDTVLKLGNRLRNDYALRAIKHFRQEIYIANRNNRTESEPTLQRKAWNDLYSKIEHSVSLFKRPEDRHDYLLALWTVSLTNESKFGGVYSDQIVFNSTIFPYLMKALQFYGILSESNYVVDPNSKQVILKHYRCKHWQVVDPVTNELVSYNDPLSFQLAHIQYSPSELVDLEKTQD
jgi:hypothetical protein